MEAIDIEQLCRWAYREELSKRQTSSAEAVWQHIREFSVMGTAIDYGSGAGPQRYDLGEPDPDALLVEGFVARLPDVVLDWQGEAYAVLGDLLALVEPRPAKTAPAPIRSSMAGWTNTHGEQVRVRMPPPRQAILVRTLRPSALVTAHAAMGTRPEWHVEPPKPQGVPSTRGHGPKIIGECRGRNYYSTGSHCPLLWEPSPIVIAEARADYLAWWRALALLARGLHGKLRRYKPLPPRAPEMPWR
jgi:hypothetical protein